MLLFKKRNSTRRTIRHNCNAIRYNCYIHCGTIWYDLYTYIEGVVGIEYADVLLDAYEIILSLFIKKQEQIMVTSVMSVKWNAALINIKHKQRHFFKYF